MPILSKRGADHHQIDLRDMGKKFVVEQNGQIYRYVLAVMDVFRRFIWLIHLACKQASPIAKCLYTFFTEFGPPRVI